MPLRKCHLQYISFCFCSTWWNIYFWWHTCNILQPHPILKEPFLLGCILRTWTKRRMQHVDVSYIYIYTYLDSLSCWDIRLSAATTSCYPLGNLQIPCHHFWKWFSFSPGGICDRFLRVINKIQLLTLDMGDVCHHKSVTRFRNVACRFFRRSQQRLALAAWKTKTFFGWLSRLVVKVGSRMLL